MMMCKKCTSMTGWLLLIFGILFLLVDLGIWTFWNIQWWTALLVVFGLIYICSNSCADCCEMMYGTKTKKK